MAHSAKPPRVQRETGCDRQTLGGVLDDREAALRIVMRHLDLAEVSRASSESEGHRIFRKSPLVPASSARDRGSPAPIDGVRPQTPAASGASKKSPPRLIEKARGWLVRVLGG